MTIDEQIAALEPLTPGVIAAMVGYKAAGSITTKRARGRGLTAEQLARAATRLRALADEADALAEDARRGTARPAPRARGS